MESASRLPLDPSRTDVMSFLSGASRYGNLGLFIGAGFSKAVLNSSDRAIALSWGALLEAASRQMDVNYAAVQKEGADYPAIASGICKAYSDSTGENYTAAVKRLKRSISALTAWYPTPEARDRFGNYLRRTSPAWIITTNYDLVIENLLTGSAESLGPNDPLSSPRGVIPVFHLHGSRAIPDELIATQEDYVSLFRPTEYRQIRLTLTIHESTTLLLGYGLGDVNVLTALDWSQNVFRHRELSLPSDVIQVLRVDQPRPVPYRDRNGILILEVPELTEFFDEFLACHAELSRLDEYNRTQLNAFAEEFRNPGSNTVENFIDDPQFRGIVLDLLARNSTHLLPGFVSFLDRCIQETWIRAEPRGGFEGYNQNLIIVLDILTAFPMEKFPPALFQTLAFALDRVSKYVGNEIGQSWEAGKNWQRRKDEIYGPVLDELWSFARQNDCRGLVSLLDFI